MNIGASMIKIAVTGFLLGGLAAGGTAGATGMVQLQASSPEASGAQFAGHHDPRAELDISMALPLRNAAALDTFLFQLRDKSSPNYHKFLTQKQFTAAYGPTQAQVTEVETFLKQRGLTVTSVSKGRTRIHATGSTTAIEAAFGIAVNDYTYQGGKYFAASTGPSLPQNIAALVSHVFGLENIAQYRSHALTATASATQGVGPRGFTPLQIATAYGWPALTVAAKAKAPAAGVTVAIATAFSFRQADIEHFWSSFGVPAHPLTVIPIDGSTRQLEFETTLDVEESSTMSPGSNMLVYDAVDPNDQPFDDMYVQIADDDLADVVSTSWGLSESVSEQFEFGSVQTEHAAIQQMTAEGMVFIAASGDDGSADRTSGTDNADFPASDPFTVAAGGTSLTLNTDNTIATEVVWNDGPGSSAGGADSILFAEPDYQTNLSGWVSNTSCESDHTGDFPTVAGIPGLGCTGTGAASRQNSDIAMDADPETGYASYVNGRWAQGGGTSYVAPELAGFYAIVTARLRAALKAQHVSGASTARVGQGNPDLYKDYGLNVTDFNDIISGNNGMFSAGTGWDHPTGLGTPHSADTLMNNLVVIMTETP
jgi:kumamolisin